MSLFGNKKQFVNDISFGIQRHFALAFVLFAFIFVIGLITGKGYGGIFVIIYGIPASIVISGIYNGFVLTHNQCPEASKVNWILALTAFIISGTCTFIMIH
jgi:hypothetical protein